MRRFLSLIALVAWWSISVCFAAGESDPAGAPADRPQEGQWGSTTGELQVALMRDADGNPLFVEYQKVGDLAVFQGDIVLGRHEDLQKSLHAGMMNLNQSDYDKARSTFPQLAQQLQEDVTVDFGLGVLPLNMRWPQRTIPYGIAPEMPAAQRAEAEAAVAAWNATGAVRLVTLDTVPESVLGSTDRVGR